MLLERDIFGSQQFEMKRRVTTTEIHVEPCEARSLYRRVNWTALSLAGLIFATALLFISLDHQKIADAIVGGQPDSVSQQTTVLLTSDLGSCTGSLIASKWVLTAAHCLVGASSMDVRAVDVVSGRPIWTASGTRYLLQGYDELNSINDVGLLEIRESISAPYAVLASSVEVSAVEELGGVGIASGFGRTSNGGSPSAIALRVSVQLVPRSICQSNWFYNSRYSLDFICTAPSVTATICNGDSGGPLFLEIGGVRKIAGVTSFGASSGCGMNFSVFTRIPTFLNWIQGIIGVSTTSTTIANSSTSVAQNSQVVVIPSLPPVTPVVVPPLFPTVSDSRTPALPKFSTSRAFQLVVVKVGSNCSVDIDADSALRGRRLDVFLSKYQKLPSFRRILDKFGDTVVLVQKPCTSVLREGVFVSLDNSTIRLRARL